MIPPCDPVILHNNPQFKRLYEQVTTTFLNPDGSTRADDAQPTRKAVLDDLKECRIRDARTKIKKQTLRRLAFDPDSGLPEEFRDPAAIVYLYLESCPDLFNLPADNDNQPDANALQLLAPDISLFYCNLPDLIEPFSRILLADLQDLRTITDAGTDSDTSSAEAPTGEPSRTRARTRQMTTRSRRAIDSQPFTLASQLNKRIRALRHLQLSELPAARTRMAATAAEVLATRAAVLERMVILLERAKHGAFARATKAKAEHLVTVAQELNGRLKVMKLEISATIHTPEVIAALGRYWDHLERTRERWEERRVAALEELKAYGVEDKDGKGGEENASRDTIRSEHESMKEVYRRYGTLIREIEAKSREIKRMDELKLSHAQLPRETIMADDAISIYDEIEIEDMTFDPNLQIYHYPCPCGDRFEIAIDDLRDGEDIAVCPSCSLMIRVIFDEADLANHDDKNGSAGAVAVQA
ncbi:zf-CSL-domain-containing protein [Aspergillus saccharolyticus JOP 1030-1]|uniref:Diphthamide biosynthesis protein 3 n=1 Tax=Aspergillus saccharolyticus JOP 1030-1 TaxID=1450539 RepID=A0A318ZEX3_9EURO|nr:zf-CSL-domain-containing protein [Aspergillus saccharolyticus JOP 1030-1]PYH45227.1 zf-CSL-domain-containing protein [Aspergillus saccharolyticus JOP 1030-1]